MKKFFLINVFLFLLVFPFSQINAEKITILHTNDSHTSLLPKGPRNQMLIAPYGGIARFAKLVGQTRVENPSTLVFHAGDFSIGDILYCKNFGIAELMLMSMIGVDAVTLGNHEFDLGPENLELFISMGKTSPNLKLLCANGDFDGMPSLKSKILKDTIYEIGSSKVGVFGMTTPEVMLLSNPSPVNFSMNAEIVQQIVVEEVTKLKLEGCDIVIMLSHMGYAQDVALAQIPGINAVIGGHDHFLLPEAVEITNMEGKTCYVVQVGAFYEYAGRFDFDITDGEIDFVEWQLIPLNEDIPESEGVVAVLDALKADLEETYGNVFTQMIGVVTETLRETTDDLKTDGYKDTQVGNLVADAFKAWGETDIGLTACGMTSNPLYQGPIVPADVYRMTGYGLNEVNGLGFRMCTFEMTGMDILKGLQFGLGNISVNDDFLLIGSDLFYEYKFITDAESPFFMRGMLLPESVKVSGLPIDPMRWYSVTTQEGILAFLDMLKAGTFGEEFVVDYRNLVLDEEMTEFLVLVQYLSQMEVITYPNKLRVLDVKNKEIENSLFLQNKAFPNPSFKEIKIDFNVCQDGNYKVFVYNQKGILVEEFNEGTLTKGSFRFVLSTQNYSNGVYSVVLTDGVSNQIARFVVLK